MLSKKVNIIVGENLRCAAGLAKVFFGSMNFVLIKGETYMSALEQVHHKTSNKYNLILEYPEIGCSIKKQKEIVAKVMELVDKYETISLITYSNYILTDSIYDIIPEHLLGCIHYENKNSSFTIIDKEKAKSILFGEEI